MARGSWRYNLRRFHDAFATATDTKRLMCGVSSVAQGVTCLSGLRGGLSIDYREIILLWCDLNGGAENYMDKNWTRFVPLIHTVCLRPEEDENTIKQKYLQIVQK